MAASRMTFLRIGILEFAPGCEEMLKGFFWYWLENHIYVCQRDDHKTDIWNIGWYLWLWSIWRLHIGCDRQNPASNWGMAEPSAFQRLSNRLCSFDNWDVISPIFKFSTEVQTAFYATNVIESLNSSYRRLNHQRSIFPSAQALLKALYLATLEATKNWTVTIRN